MMKNWGTMSMMPMVVAMALMSASSVFAQRLDINGSSSSNQSLCSSDDISFFGSYHTTFHGTFTYRWNLLRNNVSIRETASVISCDPGQLCELPWFNYSTSASGMSGNYQLRLRVQYGGVLNIRDVRSNTISLSVANAAPTAISKINGNSNWNVPVDHLGPIRLDGSASLCASGYFVSIQLSDANWNRYGHEAMAWLDSNLMSQYGSIDDFDIRSFAEDRWMSFSPGQFYRVKLAVSAPWNETTKLIEITPSNLPAVRLRHKSTGKCAYEYGGDGARARNWTCWDDPHMAYLIQDIGNGEVRLRHSVTGKCLYGSPNNGGAVSHWGCWNDPNMTYIVEQLGGGEVRLRHKSTGKCIYGSPSNGGGLSNWTCWNDPNMVYVLDEF